MFVREIRRALSVRALNERFRWVVDRLRELKGEQTTASFRGRVVGGRNGRGGGGGDGGDGGDQRCKLGDSKVRLSF